MIEKIEITQNYTFSRYYSFNTEFVIDFIDNLAYFSYHNEKEIFEKMELFISEESYSIYQDYYNSYFKTKLCLSNEESKEFLEEYNKLNLFEDYIESKSLESHDIDNLKRYVITIYKSNSKQKYILNYPPKNGKNLIKF